MSAKILKNPQVLIAVFPGGLDHRAFTKIGHPACPTQHDVDRLQAMAHAIKTTTVVKTTDKRTKHQREIEALLEDLGDLI